MRVGGFDVSTSNGDGVRFVIFFQGCERNCPNCQNPQTHDFTQGSHFSIVDLVEHIKLTGFKKITFSGGEPFYQATDFQLLLIQIREFVDSIWVYTGYTIEELVDEFGIEVLTNIDVLVDGPYIDKLRNTDMPYVGGVVTNELLK